MCEPLRCSHLRSLAQSNKSPDTLRIRLPAEQSRLQHGVTRAVLRHAIKAAGDDARAGAASRVHVAVYDYAEHAGDSLAFTPPTVPVGALRGSAAPGAGHLMYTRVKQSALFRGDANSRWWGSCLGQHRCMSSRILHCRAWRLLWQAEEGTHTQGMRLRMG